MIEMISDRNARHADMLSAPVRGVLPNVLPIPLGIPKVGIPKGIAKARFSLSHRLSPSKSASQPPAPITSSWCGRLGSKAQAVGQGKTNKQKTENRRRRQEQETQEEKTRNKGDEDGDAKRGRLAEVGRVVQLTKRDEAMLDWLSIVRMADQDTICWALAALVDGHTDRPVSVRRGNQWIAKLAEEGLLERAQPAFNDRSIIWATHYGIGRVAPNLYRQTTRHEIAVAAVSARYLARGYSWFRDRRPANPNDHQADGVAVKGDDVQLVEVELTPKNIGRYKGICTSHATRMTTGGISRVVYFGTTEANRVVASEADKLIFRTERHRLLTLPTFDVRGRWVGYPNVLWNTLTDPAGTAGAPTATNPELWDAQAIG